jgi:hypothetical protein
MAHDTRMNHPVLSSHATSRRFLRHLLVFGAGIALTLLLLTPEHGSPQSKSKSPAGAVAAAPPSQLLPSPSATAPEPGAEVKPAPPVPLATTAEMNTLVDGPLPLDVKIASLAAVMRSPDSRLAAEAARRAVFLIGAADYTRLAAPLLLDAALAPSALQVLALNTYDRDTQYTLPIMARIVNTPGHALQTEAAETLAFHLQEKAAVSGEALVQNVEEWLRSQRTVSSSK